MIRMLVASAAVWLVLCGPAVAEQASFSTPPASREVVQAEDAVVSLRYDANAWAIAPRQSKYRMFAIVTHSDAKVSGMLVYRGEPATEEAVRERAVAELEMFPEHEVEFSRRTVNGVPVLFMKAIATKSDGNDLVVRSYYWLGASGVVDYAVMAPREQFDRHRESVMGLLNGLEINEARAAH